MENSGCAIGKSKSALNKLRARYASDYSVPIEHTLYGVIGPFCSNDCQDITNKTYRDEIGWNGLAISGGSTSPALGTTVDQDADYPNLARTATPESHLASGARAIYENFDFKRVAILADDSLWGSGSGHAFETELVENLPGSDILSAGQPWALLALAEWDAALNSGAPAQVEALALAVLQGLESVDAKIVFLAVQPRIQREIFRYSFTTGMIKGTGFSWFIAWISEGILSEPDGSPCPDCLRGAEGAIGMIEGAAEASAGQLFLEKYWTLHSSRDNCAVQNDDWEAAYQFDPSVKTAFCDSDGDPTTVGGYTLNAVDAVMAYAAAMTAVLKEDPTAVNNADKLYAEMKKMYAADSIDNVHFSASESKLKLDAFGDKLGNFKVANLQINHGDLGARARGRDRRKVVLEAASAEFKIVGEFSTDATVGLYLYPKAPGTCEQHGGGPVIIFPGGGCEAPLDAEAETAFPPEAIGGIVATVVLLIVGLVVMKWHNNKKIGVLKAELHKLSKSLVGVRHVKRDFAGPSGGRSVMRHSVVR